MRRSTVLVAALAVACTVAAGCGGGTGDDVAVTLPPGKESPLVTALPSRINGPQGRTGQFVAKCGFSHRGPNDPIVHYDMPGMSHSSCSAAPSTSKNNAVMPVATTGNGSPNNSNPLT